MTGEPHLSASNAASPFDLLVIGGGVNGAGIARDAAGRGFSVCLCEAGDFAAGTSSASTKLLHGGLRYLEYFEIRLVREALIEREILLQAMPHISRPMRFVLPYHDDMRFEGETTVSKWLSFVMPWLKGRRPAWLIRLGLFFYDHLGGRKILPGTKTLDLTRDAAGKPLKKHLKKAYEYSDGWVEDSRLVILNLRDARARGADVNRSTRVETADFKDGLWHVTARDTHTGAVRHLTARMVVNAAGPWVDRVLNTVFDREKAGNVRLVRGSHIVVPKKFDHDRCYFFQNRDSRIIFAIPYEGDYTMIGTTDADHGSDMVEPRISADEIRYLCDTASAYFAEPVRDTDIVWTFSGVRPLYDDGATAAQAATRDYILRRDKELGGGTLINIFGGKITTYRKLAEAMLEEIEATLGQRGAPWTHDAKLPGGDFEIGFLDHLVDDFCRRHPFVDRPVMERLVRHYGTDTPALLRGARSPADLGGDFGHGLYAAELRYLIEEEWARTAEDVLFRRTRLGLRMTPQEIEAVDAWMAAHVPEAGSGRPMDGVVMSPNGGARDMLPRAASRANISG